MEEPAIVPNPPRPPHQPTQKADYPSRPLHSLTLTTPPLLGKLFPWQLFPQCRSPPAGTSWSVSVLVEDEEKEEENEEEMEEEE